MDPQELNDELQRRREEQRQGGGQEAIARQHAKGKRTARERIVDLLDPGSFQEMDPFLTHRHTGGTVDQDISALKSELTDPRFANDHWKSQIKLQLKIKKKSEQQALAKYGLDFVTDTYLPEKLKEMNII